MYRVLTVFCLTSILCACHKPKVRQVNRSFYYWKSIYEVTDREARYLQNLKVNTLYVKLFDVTWHDINRAIPVAQLKLETTIPDSINIIPTVFITNETLLNMREGEAAVVGVKIHQKINQILEATQLQRHVNEIQIDCDWNSATRAKYFAVLTTLKARLNGLTLSATIRLHQIKYQKQTGVPPVDKGMLMLYNMSSVKELSNDNSIFSERTAKSYLSEDITYPLQLDIALPIFSWGAAFHDGKFNSLLNNLSRAELQDCIAFSGDAKTPTNFICTTDTVFRDVYFRRGDIIRLEDVSVSELQNAHALTNGLYKNDTTINISFFHVDSTLMNRYDHEDLEKIYSSFSY